MIITVLTLAVAHPVLTLSPLGVISLPYFHPAKLVQILTNKPRSPLTPARG
ncbi:hypothetical protein [Sphaerospermopsis sp. LEGE 00249]|uniref:hypothetical protein n=1 Tax=Sphaerospermopsis sp. LEGE 00249 TaxID=1380707 RepID=UPI001C9B7B86|nr:hypothetical protein [Sphaerospermopsis sp. LEGE 00249]